MPSVDDNRTHLITARAFDDGIWQGSGCYRAVCGVTVVADAMASQFGPNCLACHEHARAIA
ncbi:MAG: hypothetical protein ACRDRH_08500 [Pseudonocardia sp.]